MRLHNKGREQQREDDRVAHQVDPEAACLFVDGAFGFFGFRFFAGTRGDDGVGHAGAPGAIVGAMVRRFSIASTSLAGMRCLA